MAVVGTLLVLFNPAVTNAVIDATEYSVESISQMLDRASFNWLRMRGSLFKAEETEDAISSDESGI